MKNTMRHDLFFSFTSFILKLKKFEKINFKNVIHTVNTFKYMQMYHLNLSERKCSS